MSAYGPFYSEEQIWDIAAFIEHIKTLPPGVLERIQSKAAKDAGDLEQALVVYKTSVEINVLTPTQPEGPRVFTRAREVVPALVDFSRVRGRHSRAALLNCQGGLSAVNVSSHVHARVRNPALSIRLPRLHCRQSDLAGPAARAAE